MASHQDHSYFSTGDNPTADTGMTQLLSHTIAHFTGPSFMFKANNQPYEKISGLALS